MNQPGCLLRDLHWVKFTSAEPIKTAALTTNHRIGDLLKQPPPPKKQKKQYKTKQKSTQHPVK